MNRKKPESLGIPKVPQNFHLSYGMIIAISVLGIIFPLFGLSVLVIFLIVGLRKLLKK